MKYNGIITGYIALWGMSALNRGQRYCKEMMDSIYRVCNPGIPNPGIGDDVQIPGFRDYKNSSKSHFFER